MLDLDGKWILHKIFLGQSSVLDQSSINNFFGSRRSQRHVASDTANGLPLAGLKEEWRATGREAM